MSNVLMFVEQTGGVVKKSSLPAVNAAQRLANGGEYDLVVIGDGAAKAAEALKTYGPAAVHVVEGPAFTHYLAEPYARAIAEAAKAAGATLVGASATTQGKDVMPRVAVRLDATGMASEVLGFEGAGADITFRRPMWAGNAVATVKITTPAKVFTVRTTEFGPPATSTGAAAIKPLTVDAGAPKTKFISFKEVKSARPELTEARIVVSGGRGTKGDFKAVEALADELGAAVGASRAVVDAGWQPNDLQVGQTGKVVAPELYVAAGISGAIQHLAGMKGSKVIVAIYKDPEAPIFQVADYGLVADLFKALPELQTAIKATK